MCKVILVVATACLLSAQVPSSSVPITADYDVVVVRSLSDGNTLRTAVEGKFYRDQSGRTRVEQNQVASITDPVTHTGILLDLAKGTARTVVLPARDAQPLLNQVPHIRARKGDQRIDAVAPKKELGTRDFDGIQATGQEYVTVIPVGSPLGNWKPIEHTTEVWVSTTIQLPVLTIMSDPLNGRRELRYRNVKADADPDPSLFTIPPGFTVDRSSPIAKQ